jgi:hypothetical protein
MAAGIQDADCLCNRPAGVSFILIQGQRVGLSGIGEVFARWSATSRRPDQLDAGEILAALRERNYVSRSVEGQYVEAVRAAYASLRPQADKGAAGAQG